MSRSRGFVAVAIAAIALVVSSSTTLRAVGPAVIMFYGPGVKQTVLVTGADTSVFPDLTRSSGVAASETSGRTYIKVAIFWFVPPEGVSALRIEKAWQHGRYYPATASQAALLLVTQFTKGEQPLPTENTPFPSGGVLSEAAVVVLKRVGVAR